MQNHNYTKRFFFIFLIFIYSCLDNVKHDNPLDPHNKNSGFSISGKVSSLYSPVKPIFNAVLSLHPGDLRIFSDIDGNFMFDGLEKGSYTIFSDAQGYSKDSLQLDLSEDKQINFFLDGLPYFENIQLTTHHTSRFFPIDDMFFLQIATRVNDSDGIGDINKVYFDIPEINASDTLNASLETGSFSIILSVEDLPVNTIHTLIGRRIILSVSDDAGITIESDPKFLTRVIDITPVVTSLVNLQTVSNDSLLFTWEKIRLPYWFTHTIEIYQINLGLLTKVIEIKNISQDRISYTMKNNLNTADYVWILSVSDEFGNTSSSKEGAFHVDI